MQSEISAQEYRRVLQSGQAENQQQQVYDHIRRTPRCTRRDVADDTGIEISSVCARVAELLELRIIAEQGKANTRRTGRPGAALVVQDDPQGDLFH